METKSKILTVVLCVYNAEKYLSEAIESILNQTYKNFDFFIVDDGSTDQSLDIIKKYANANSRIFLHENVENKGVSYSRNYAISQCKTKYIALMDADDVSLPERIEKQINFLENHPNISVCGTWFTLFGENINQQLIQHPEGHDQIKVNMLFDCCIGNPTLMFKSEIFNNFQFIKKYIPIDDYELWSRALFKYNFSNIQESLLNYRWHSTNISQTKKVDINKLHLEIRKNQLLNLKPDLTEDQLSKLDSLTRPLNAIPFNELIKVLDLMKELLAINLKKNIYNQNYLKDFFYKNCLELTKSGKGNSLKFTWLIISEFQDVFNLLNFKEKKRLFKKCFRR
jgi:glycosyltransferase involved in cell wall biosynthesis